MKEQHKRTKRTDKITTLVERYDYSLSFNLANGISVNGWTVDHWGDGREPIEVTKKIYQQLKQLTQAEAEALKSVYCK